MRVSRRQIWKIKQIIPPTSGDEKQEAILANSTSAKQGEPQVLASADNTRVVSMLNISVKSPQNRLVLPCRRLPIRRNFMRFRGTLLVWAPSKNSKNLSTSRQLNVIFLKSLVLCNHMVLRQQNKASTLSSTCYPKHLF